MMKPIPLAHSPPSPMHGTSGGGTIALLARHVDVRTALAIGVSLVCWASAFPGIRAGLDAYHPASLALLRYLIASVVLAGCALVAVRRLPDRRDIPMLLLSGLFGFTGYNLALNSGETNVSAGVASFLIASVPIFVALAASVFLRERIPMWGWIGIVVSFLGVAVIVLGRDGILQVSHAASTGMLLVLLAAICQSLYFILQKPLLTRYTPLEFTTYAVWAGTFLLLPGIPGMVQDLQASSPQSTAAVLYLGVVPGALGYVSWAYVLSRISAATAGSFIYALPLFAALISWVWLGEVPGALSFAGGALILSGVILVNTQRRSSARRRAPPSRSP